VVVEVGVVGGRVVVCPGVVGVWVAVPVTVVPGVVCCGVPQELSTMTATTTVLISVIARPFFTVFLLL
jgi:hypothetical protein